MSALLPAAAGAAAGHLWAASGLPSIFVPLFIFLAVSITCSAPPARRADAANTLLLACCGVVLGLLTGQLASSAPGESFPVLPGRITLLEGEVLGVRGDRGEQAITVRLSAAGSPQVSGSARGIVGIRVPDSSDLRVGDEVHISGVDETSLWRDRSGRLWMRADGAARAGGRESPPLSVVAVAAGARTRIRTAIDQAAGRASPLLAALLLGDGSDVDPRVELLFRRSGAIHLLALSGMHLAVIAMLVRAVVRPFGGPLMAMVLALAASGLYVLLVGPRPGLVRACLLVAFGTMATIADRPRPLVELLAACFLAQLLIQPGMARSLGFQLSYLSLLGISLMATPLSELGRRWIPRAVAGPLAAGTGAQVMTLPLLIARFGQWYPAGVIATVVMGPLVLLFMTGGLIAVVAAIAGVRVVALVSVPVLEALYRVIEGSGWLFAAGPLLAPQNPQPFILCGAVAAAISAACGLAYLTRRACGV